MISEQERFFWEQSGCGCEVQLFLARFWKHFYFRTRISKSGSHSSAKGETATLWIYHTELNWSLTLNTKQLQKVRFTINYFLCKCWFWICVVSASENKVKEKGSVPRVIIVAVVLGIILVVIVKVTQIIGVTFISICLVLVRWYFGRISQLYILVYPRCDRQGNSNNCCYIYWHLPCFGKLVFWKNFLTLYSCLSSLWSSTLLE